MKSPLILNDGVGVDSMAMCILLRNRKERPDLLMFADTGNEKPETYDYIPILRLWLVENGFPDLTVVRRPPTGRVVQYTTLRDNCIANETLPSLAFNLKGCSLKWKQEAMDMFLLGVSRGKNKRVGWPMAVLAMEAGVKITKCIGYDAGVNDSKRGAHVTDSPYFEFRYPLREEGWDREKCIEVIKAEGLPVPVKSACYFCPASQAWEVYWLAAMHPDLFLDSIFMEDNARNGKHGLHEVVGLWGRNVKDSGNGRRGQGSWRSWAELEGIIAPGGSEVILSKDRLLYRASLMKPPEEANLVQIGG
jgi:hypothetical protein